MMATEPTPKRKYIILSVQIVHIAKQLSNREATSSDVSLLDDIYHEMHNVSDTLVLVEGPNDKRSLEKLGFQNVVFMDQPLYRIVESYEGEEELLLLTDLDAHGKKLYKYFYHEFTKRGVRVNSRLRLLLLRTPVKHIEGLYGYLHKRAMEQT